MRPLRSLLITLAAISALAALAPAVSAAGATTTTLRESFQHTDDHGDEAYIFDVEAVLHLTTRPDGTVSVTNNVRQVQTHTVLGEVVDVIISNSAQHALYRGEDQLLVSHVSSHDRYAAGDASCQTTIVWQVVANELVMHHFKSVCP